ncbi:SDR family NAD(P)-dependent oxidoreductase [Rubellimicrobium aerolatum]|uniref:SDR family NAD(P)-dependent oxidoreductase n=1 Tax=Rubellimicrobium aerolatum TaxID=490979 RepID=A0ABW0S972_9RHOB|nr:SDR family NAD(P)-dependent oxidoreductase [Rubellimicrobium aerolatum]MBP1804847.1 NAD(P)-dependent dehydrogenase (short-subunit alcohol dehydrogenase family) [Rubellimicrobium aerolatum]
MSVFEGGRSAVVTGAAGGIGLAVARACLGRGMRVTLADRDGERLEAVAVALASEAPDRVAQAVCDVADPASVEHLREVALAAHGPVDLLVNNAGIGRASKPWGDRAAWEATLGVNLWGVLNGLAVFVPGMMAGGREGAVVNLGSKQGITNPPGNAAYNVSKAGVKAVTEQLAWEFRQVPGGRLSAHLLVPGFTWTGMTGTGDRPEGAWTADQVAARMIEGVEAGAFYIICPDNEVDWATDRRRIAWGAGDLTEGRPALSRWHPDWAEAFGAYPGP